MGDVLSTGYWAAQISEIQPEDTVLILGPGPTGLCTLQCVRLRNPRRIIVCDLDQQRLDFVRRHYPEVLTAPPEGLTDFVRQHSDHGGADVVLEVAGSDDSFRMAWQCAGPTPLSRWWPSMTRPRPLPLPDMYGKNLTFKTGGVDGCHCGEILELIAQGKLDTTPLITHTFPLQEIERPTISLSTGGTALSRWPFSAEKAVETGIFAGLHRFLLLRSLIVRTVIAGFAAGGLAVLNGPHRTEAEAGHTVGTLVPQAGFPPSSRILPRGTRPGTFRRRYTPSVAGNFWCG